MNPLLQEEREYPFARLLETKRRRQAEGRRVLDFGQGDPRDPTPAFIRRALVDGVPEVSSYPTVKGKSELRDSIARYLKRRFGLDVDPARHILPVTGTKEGIFTSHLALLDPHGTRRGVVVFEPAYPVYVQGARYAGGTVHAVTVTRQTGFRPDPESLDPEVLARTAVMWINYPHNPTGAEADVGWYARMRELSREHHFILASDECYADVGFGAPHPSVLVPEEAPDFEGVLAFHSCSKRSCMTGFRSGFVVGDPKWIAVLARFRPSVGVATPAFVQDAATAAWDDDAHVQEIVERYRRRREHFLEAFARRGWHHDGGNATFYLWLRVPEGFGDAIRFADRLLEEDILVTPGPFLGAGGEEHVRFALVSTEDDSREAAARLQRIQP
ncbi:MAG: aminotransferase class I/II-fold pyridoxal phosphate-dependent enzyme [Vicinamibacterales bacterium]|nr:aminotransferase class I/II-fold pyridoxal phosphate-dependent enzyme [Vicinamibacterales bacterium]